VRRVLADTNRTFDFNGDDRIGHAPGSLALRCIRRTTPAPWAPGDRRSSGLGFALNCRSRSY
jgi:hypothetical protein